MMPDTTVPDAARAGLAAGAGFEVRFLTGAVYYPPCDALARSLAPFDPWLARHTIRGAAFLALVAEKPKEASP